MAVQWNVKEAPTRGSVYNFFPQDIVIKPDLNGRHDLPDIGSLKQDILARGQIQPVGIRNDGGKPVLAFGFSRWRAVSELNQNEKKDDPIKLMCLYIRMNEQEAYLANYKENRTRATTTPLDDAHIFARMERWGKTISQIAELVGESESFVKQRLALVDMTPEAQEAVKTGRLKPTAAVAIAKLSAKQQREVVAGEGKVTGSKVANVIGKARKPTPKQSLEGLMPVIQEAADNHSVKAVQDFARKLLWLIEVPDTE
jgi:ParB/RepB/Spo0J family partition protein